MFSVPGWSVSPSALKIQTADTIKSQSKQSIKPPNPTFELTGKASKKRKRPKGKTIVNAVDSKNLAELWETVICKKPKEQSDAGKIEALEKHQRAIKRGNGSASTSKYDPIPNDAKTEDPKMHKGRTAKRKFHLQQPKGVLSAHPETTEASVVAISNTQLTPLQISMRQKLISARFRHLNQRLYTTSSARSLELFQENPEMFEEYHEGFRRQVEVWPENPVDGYIMEIKHRAIPRHAIWNATSLARNNEDSTNLAVLPLPRTHGVCRIADLGCGNARISYNLDKLKKKLKIEVFSYDLQSTNPLVTKADIANLPLEDGSIDIAIFCLALMGTNWIDFIEEAFRILKWKGELWIAEIKSRFGRISNKHRKIEHSVGNKKRASKEAVRKLEAVINDADLLVEIDGQEDNKGETDVSNFVEVLRKRGFVQQTENGLDLSNKMFVKMSFMKRITPVKGKCVPLGKGMEGSELGKWAKTSKANFLDTQEALTSSEASVLKPCIYKIR